MCAGVLEGCCRGRVPQSQGTFLPHYHCPQEFRYILNSFHSTAVHSKLWAAAVYIVQCTIYGSVGSVTFSGFGSFWEMNSGFGSLKKYYMDTDWFTVMKIIPVYMFKFLFLRYCIRFTCLDLDPFVRSKEWIRIRNNGKAWSGSGPGPGPVWNYTDPTSLVIIVTNCSNPQINYVWLKKSRKNILKSCHRW